MPVFCRHLAVSYWSWLPTPLDVPSGTLSLASMRTSSPSTSRSLPCDQMGVRLAAQASLWLGYIHFYTWRGRQMVARPSGPSGQRKKLLGHRMLRGKRSLRGFVRGSESSLRRMYNRKVKGLTTLSSACVLWHLTYCCMLYHPMHSYPNVKVLMFSVLSLLHTMCALYSNRNGCVSIW